MPAYTQFHFNESIKGKSFHLSSSVSSIGSESLTIQQPAYILIFLFFIINDLISILLSNSPFQSILRKDPQYGPLPYFSISLSLWQDLNFGAPVIEPPGQQAASKSTQLLVFFNFPLITDVR